MQLSHVQGLTEPPLLELTIGAAFDKTCDTWPDQEAIICPTQSIRLNWSALRARVDNFASGLFTFRA